MTSGVIKVLVSLGGILTAAQAINSNPDAPNTGEWFLLVIYVLGTFAYAQLAFYGWYWWDNYKETETDSRDYIDVKYYSMTDFETNEFDYITAAINNFT